MSVNRRVSSLNWADLAALVARFVVGDLLSAEEYQELASRLEPARADSDSIAAAWWGFTIAGAIEGDELDRQNLAEATGDPDAWMKLSPLAAGARRSDPLDETGWTDLVAEFIADPLTLGVNRLHQGDAGFDSILDGAGNVLLKLAFAYRERRPEAIPHPT